MIDNNTDYSEGFFPEGFPFNGAFVIRDIQCKDWWPYRPVDGVVDALWFAGRRRRTGGPVRSFDGGMGQGAGLVHRGNEPIQGWNGL
ncbi:MULTISPECIES: hypothetical protein [Actinomyces]|uniref:Uncharacterized protein n=1 Tax=Actinomyces respiraculi TaxID=2744574 RepID=A0A7T0LLM2_9ACTO|nr:MULTISPECIES: hypothetical protein [Actinomyces]QPL06034.1 hypothetical protein ID810_03565 [Actinomyces respiraculi]